MLEFFKGWRRKIGVMTLVIACVFTSLWMRSLASTDALVLSVGKYKKQSDEGGKIDIEYGTTLYIVKSEMSTLILSRTSFESMDEQRIDEVKAKCKYPEWESAVNSVVDPMIANAEWQFCGFGFCTLFSDGEAIEHHLFMRYWSITTFVTLIAFGLLLSNPRQSIQKKNAESTAKEGL